MKAVHSVLERLAKIFLLLGLALFLVSLGLNVGGIDFPWFFNFVIFAFILLGAVSILLTLGRIDKSLERHENDLFDHRIDPLMAGITHLALGDLTYRIPLPEARKASADASGRLDMLLHRMEQKIDSGINDYLALSAPPLSRLIFVGSNAYQEGVIAAREAARLIGNQGKVAIILPRFSDINHSFRVKGFVHSIAENSPRIEIVATEENLLSNDMRGNSVSIVKAFLAKFPQLDLIYLTEGYTPVVCAEVIKKAGAKTKLLAFDVWEDNIKGVEIGPLEVLMEQDTLKQGYMPILAVYNYIEFKQKPIFPKMTTEPITIPKSELVKHWSREKQCRVFGREQLEALPKPRPRKTSNKLKFAFVVPQANQIWAGILVGVAEAQKNLAPEGVSIDIFDASLEPGADAGIWGTKKYFDPVFEKVRRGGYQALFINVPDASVIPVLDEFSRSGVVVATFNSEPFGFREVIQTLHEGLNSLTGYSETLAAAATESSQSSEVISMTMQSIVKDTQRELGEVEGTSTVMKSLSSEMDSLVSAVGEISNYMDTVTLRASEGKQSVHRSSQVTNELQQSQQALETQISTLVESINNISSVVETIEGFANETNVLAINAAIQASRAGEQGKGFAVVAQAVRQLAEKSNSAAGTIQDLIKKTRKVMDTAVSMVQQGSGAVAVNRDMAGQADAALVEVLEHCINTQNQLKLFSGRISTVDGISQQVGTAMQVLRELIALNEKRIQEISGSTDEMSVQGNELAKTANDLLDMARDQGILLSQITIKGKR